MDKTVEVYRLWPDGKWDTTKVAIATHEPLTFDIVESRAAQRAWLEITRDGHEPKPLQIGLYMPTYHLQELLPM